jgi:hypothetical protein
MGAYAAEINRVSIGPRASCPRDTYAPVRPTDIFNYDRLPKRFSHSFGEDPRHRINTSAGSQRYNHGDGASRIGLRLREL